MKASAVAAAELTAATSSSGGGGLALTSGGGGGGGFESGAGTSIVTPKEQAGFYFSRAKRLYAAGGEYACILERVVTTVLKAMSFGTEDVEHYLFLSRVFIKALDLSSALFCLRYALRLYPTDNNIKKKVAALLFMIGQELLCGALLRKKKDYTDLVHISKARAYFDECLKYEITNKTYWVYKCLCHVHLATTNFGQINMSELVAAQDAVNNACRLDRGEDAEILILRSKLLWAAGLHEQGNNDLRVAEHIAPSHPEVILFHARTRREAERLYQVITPPSPFCPPPSRPSSLKPPRLAPRAPCACSWTRSTSAPSRKPCTPWP
jgi:tetratricopeptide (TPR) repeat protein